ncbi:hypothetical protein CC79DRAFT_1363266 [Sarocladium strictum]
MSLFKSSKNSKAAASHTTLVDDSASIVSSAPSDITLAKAQNKAASTSSPRSNPSATKADPNRSWEARAHVHDKVLEDVDEQPSKSSWGPKDVEQETLINSPGVQKPIGAQGNTPRDRLGLTTVYRHPNGGPIKLDIIFVHDIHGGSHSSWMTTWLGPAQEPAFWPTALLPLREPKGVPKSIWPLSLRIKTYGYQRWRPPTDGANIPALGKELLSLMLSCDDLTQSTSSIILICERFGGLVVKSALSYLSRDIHDNKIFESRIASVVFFETIHWPKSREKNASLGIYDFYEPDHGVREDLKSIGNWTPTDDHQFQTRMLPFDIFSIFLADDTFLARVGGGVAMGLINETPIRLNRSPGSKRRQPINRETHAAMVDCIMQTAYRVSRRIQVTDSMTWREADERTQLVADYLKLAPDHFPESQLQALENELAPGTCQWLLEEDDFCHWRDNHPGRQMLWITGPAGWGKTHLAAFAVRYLREKGYGDAHVYFFPFDDDRLQSPQACLLAFAYQRSLINPAFQHALIRLKTTFGALDGLKLEALNQKLLGAGLLQDVGPKTLFVLDGLDTCHDPNALLDILVSWCGSSSLRLLITSHIVQSASVPGAIMLPLQPDHARFDVGAILGTHAQFVSESAGRGLTALIRRITQRRLLRSALWASLVIDKLNECHTDADFSHALLSLPESAEVFYREAVSDVRADGTASLNIILGSVALLKYPVGLQSLVETIAESFSPDPAKDPLFPACYGLLKVDHAGQLRFRHRLARDFYIGTEDEQRSRTVELEDIHLALILSARLHARDLEILGQIPKSTRPTQSASFLIYMLLNFTWHLNQLITKPSRWLLETATFLERNMVNWATFLSHAGTYTWREAYEDLVEYYNKCSYSADLSQAEDAALDSMKMFLKSSGPLKLKQKGTKQGQRKSRLATTRGGPSASRRSIQVELFGVPPRHFNDELGELQKTLPRR